jgi:hypothetical protein
LTRYWHQYSISEFPSVGGDDALAFAAAFYSPDHPVFDERLAFSSREAPPETSFVHGWAAICFEGDSSCLATIERTAARASRVVRSEFVLESTLLGQPGAKERFVAVIVPPAGETALLPPPATATVEDFSAAGQNSLQPD